MHRFDAEAGASPVFGKQKSTLLPDFFFKCTKNKFCLVQTRFCATP
jgi:hypothetical protein